MSLDLKTCHEVIVTLASESNASKELSAAILASHNAFRIFSKWNAEHSIRVGIHQRNFLEIIGFSKRDSAHYALISCIHDIGKLSIPIEILEKPTSLNESERLLVERHSTAGTEFLGFINNELHEFENMLIRNHHENYDGSGYPDNLKGNDIPKMVQALRICDFFDAATYQRPYHPFNSNEKVFALMDKNILLFDPALLKLFKENINVVERPW